MVALAQRAPQRGAALAAEGRARFSLRRGRRGAHR
jgi:hypothetical protein